MFEGGLKTICSQKSEMLGWSVIYASSITEIILLILGFLLLMLILTFFSVRIASAKLSKAIKPVFKPLEDVSENISNITDGNRSYSFDVDEHSQEISTMTKSLNDTIEYRFIYAPIGDKGQYIFREPWFGFAANKSGKNKEYAIELFLERCK